jgi:uncharacterized paraquat-inducible protein A
MPEPLPRTARWAVFGAFALLVVVGVVRRAGDRPVLALVFGLAALVLGAVVIVILVGIATWVGSRIWDRWSRFDTMNEYRGTPSEKPS